MTTIELPRQRSRRTAVLLGVVLDLGLCLGALAPAAPAAASLAKPVISSFSPTSGTAGTAATITGANFTGAGWPIPGWPARIPGHSGGYVATRHPPSRRIW